MIPEPIQTIVNEISEDAPDLEICDFNTLIEKYKIRPFSIDFVYDARSGLVFIDLKYCHTRLMRRLYEFYANTVDECGSDRFIEENYGIFKSSVSPKIYCSKTFVIPEDFMDVAFKEIIRI